MPSGFQWGGAWRQSATRPSGDGVPCPLRITRHNRSCEVDAMTQSQILPGTPVQLGHVALRVRDVDKAVEFYTEVLGLTLRHRMRCIAFLAIRADTSHEPALMPLPAD